MRIPTALRFLGDLVAVLTPFVLSAVVASALIGGLSGCLAGRDGVAATDPQSLPRYDQLVQDEEAAQALVQEAEAALSVAASSPDPADDAPAAQELALANQELSRLEAELAEMDADSAKDQAAPLAGLLPYGLGAVALELVGALGSRRKRKLYGSALRQLGKGQLLTTAGEILKAMGLQHSSPQTSTGSTATTTVFSAPVPPQE